MNKILKILLVGLVLAGLSYASSVDLQMALDEERHYAENVCAGYWPNYKGNNIKCN